MPIVPELSAMGLNLRATAFGDSLASYQDRMIAGVRSAALWQMSAPGREHELTSVSFRAAEIQWPLFGSEFDLVNAPSRAEAAAETHHDRVAAYTRCGRSRCR